ncbi:Plant self-incompatibility S1 [Dillenia turbinata]|uniref:S-protein homolog n=1 Tax=Dillenia turbinata TaxID=194707 RepID=A0AAN8ZC85_9MAGN
METLFKMSISFIVVETPCPQETELAKGITIRDSMAPLKACVFTFFLGLFMCNLSLSQKMYKIMVSNELGTQMTLRCQSQVRQFGIKLLNAEEFYAWEFSLDGEGKLPWSCIVAWEKSSGTFDAFDPSEDPTRCGPVLCAWLAKPDGICLVEIGAQVRLLTQIEFVVVSKEVERGHKFNSPLPIGSIKSSNRRDGNWGNKLLNNPEISLYIFKERFGENEEKATQALNVSFIRIDLSIWEYKCLVHR